MKRSSTTPSCRDECLPLAGQASSRAPSPPLQGSSPEGLLLRWSYHFLRRGYGWIPSAMSNRPYRSSARPCVEVLAVWEGPTSRHRNGRAEQATAAACWDHRTSVLAPNWVHK